MFQCLILIPLSILLVQCGSPINNKVSNKGDTQNKSLTAMSFQSLDLQAEVQWLEGPFGNVKKDNILIVYLKNSKGQLTDLPEGLELHFYATMPSMGHPMDQEGYFERISQGVYLNNSIRYNMPGDWLNELWIMDNKFKLKDKVQWDDFF